MSDLNLVEAIINDAVQHEHDIRKYCTGEILSNLDRAFERFIRSFYGDILYEKFFEGV